MRRGTKPSKAKVESKRTAASKSRKNEGSRVRDLEERLAEALKREADAQEQQAATAEILRVISSSPTDVQPVFDTIVRSVTRLCGAAFSFVFLTEGGMLYHPASHGSSPEIGAAIRALFPRPLDRETAAGTAILTRSVVHVPDVLEQSAIPVARETGRAVGYRSLLAVPMLRQGEALGAINVARRQPGRFSDAEVELLKTFADQAVIAIENVRLFNGTKEALEQQTATSEILRVIASSPTDVQPVFDTIARQAVRLCEASYSVVGRYDGELIHLAAYEHVRPEGVQAIKEIFPLRPSRSTTTSRAILEGTVVHVPDVLDHPDYDKSVALGIQNRSVLAVPMLRHGESVGTISVGRLEPQPFTDQQISLLQTFADQAVIAIENVRLFTELQEKNRALTQAHAQVSESLEQQTATAEILRVISQSPSDVQPVFDTIARNSVTLCAATYAMVYRFDGTLMHLAAHHNVTPAGLEALQRQWPMPPDPRSVPGRAVLDRRVVHIHDVLSEPDSPYLVTSRALGIRTMLVVPMLRDGEPIGAIAVYRQDVEPFADTQVALVATFADQAVIAIENVRLFKELEARTQDLTRSVGELRALGEVSQAVSSTLELGTVLETIVSRAVQLSGSDQGIVYEFDETSQIFHARATHRITSEHLETVRAVPISLGEGAIGRAGVMREPVQVADIQDESQPVAPQVRELLVREGMRSLLAVPLVRERRLLGGLVILRREAGAFSPDVVGILQTFATQSVLAIQNARLFRELADKSHQLEVASQHKSEFLANMSHELRTPLNAVIGFSEVLSERMFGELNEKQDEYLKDIHASGQHLLSLINDILDLSKIEAGRMELEVTDFNLPMAIDNALTLVRERAARRTIALHTTVDERLGQIQADERKIRQVLLNLLSNAIKFTPEGGRIDVHAAPRDGMVEVSVTDTGVGIAPEDQEAVFEEFKQVGTADKKVEGTGLGLALSHKFIELHGGKIWVKSQLGAGSTFTFTVPVRR